MSEPRQVHNPGSVLRMPVTAEAWRWIFNAVRDARTDNRERAVTLEQHAGEDTASGKASAKAASVFRTAAERYATLEQEINALIQRSPSTVNLGEVSEDESVIGRGLFAHRAEELAAEMEELRRRTFSNTTQIHP